MKGKSLTRKAGEKATRKGQVCRVREDGCEAGGGGQEEPESREGENIERKRNRELGTQNERQRCRGVKKVRGSPDTWCVLWLWVTRL